MDRFYGPFVDGRGAVGLLVLRLVFGGALVQHGWGKIQDPFGWMGPQSPFPGILQALAALSEFGGGIAIMLGLLTPLAALGVLATMAVAAWTHFSRGDPWVPGRPGQGAYELALAYFAIAFALLLVGPGRLSLDALLFGRRARDVEVGEG